MQTELPYIPPERKQCLVKNIRSSKKGSGIMKSMVPANAFIALDENVSYVKKRDEVVFQLFNEKLIRTDISRFDKTLCLAVKIFEKL